jgi:hypothetical protein
MARIVRRGRSGVGSFRGGGWWTGGLGCGALEGGEGGLETGNVLLGASRESSSAFQYFLICESVTLAALTRTSPSRPSLFRFGFRFEAMDLGFSGESRMITSAISGMVWLAASGSGVAIAFSRGCESFDFFPGSTVFALVTREALLLKDNVDCWEDWEDAAVGGGALRRVAGMAAVRCGMVDLEYRPFRVL